MPLLAHVIALQPTSDQARCFRRAAGCARFAYNWGLARWNELYAAGEKPSWMSLQHEFVSRIDTDFPWMRSVPSSAYSQVFRHLGNAFMRFFKKKAERPTFKRKHGSIPSFKLRTVRCHQQTVTIPRIGIVSSREALRLTGRIVSATVKADADRWTISVLVEVPETIPAGPPASTLPVIGIDLGLRSFITGSDGSRVPAPKPLRQRLRRLRRLNRRLSRRVRGSRRYARARATLARVHRRIRCIRHSFLHQLTTRIVQNHGTIVIEDLHVKGLMKNHCLARAISDVGWGEWRRQITYKCARYGRRLLLASRWYPSSKRCSTCGWVMAQLPLKQRVFTCGACDLTMDRDLNAANNLAQLSTVVETGIDARGEPTMIVRLDNRLHGQAR